MRLYFLAKGECQVGVRDHMYYQQTVRQIDQGDFFGEVALLFQCPRSATIVSSNYCTMACISDTAFYGLLLRYHDIFLEMKKKALGYCSKDKWKMFKMKLLKQIHYFGGTI